MAKSVKIWFSKRLRDGKMDNRRTLLGLCKWLDISYSTAKSRRLIEGEKGVFVVKRTNEVYEVWMENVIK